MIEVIPLTCDHIRMLADPVTEPGLKRILVNNSRYWSDMVASGRAFSAFYEGEFLGSAGFAMPWPGVAEVWLWVTDSVHRCPVLLTKLLKRTLKQIETRHGVWRISCEVRADNVRAERWVKLLGFSKECDMRRRGPDGSTFMLYAKVRD